VRPFSLALSALLALGLGGPAGAAGEWSARVEPAGAGAAPRCVLESERQPISDGYQTTWVQIRVDDEAVQVSSASVLDAGEGDLGLVIDDGAFVRADDVTGQKTAVFTAHYGMLVDDFKRGLRVRVQLRFWPTWPKTRAHSATFSLIGFTRAHAHLSDCRAP
jgi:hypothetical protein